MTPFLLFLEEKCQKYHWVGAQSPPIGRALQPDPAPESTIGRRTGAESI
jgi:hypothetical protein